VRQLTRPTSSQRARGRRRTIVKLPREPAIWLVAIAWAAAVLAPHAAAKPALGTRLLVGHSVHGHPIRARVVGDPAATTRVLVVGCIHGNEKAGEAVTRRLRSVTPPAGTAIWLLDEANPDGCAAHTRYNARGVDLNRNAPWHWRTLPRPGGGMPYSGPRALSEPESRAIRRLVRRLHPAVTIWYHQHARLVDDSGGDRRIERRYAKLVGLPFRRFGTGLPGRITGWQNARFKTATAFVVELAAGRLTRGQVSHHVKAVLDAARRALSHDS
jgi:murein peptide amidase A